MIACHTLERAKTEYLTTDEVVKALRELDRLQDPARGPTASITITATGTAVLMLTQRDRPVVSSSAEDALVKVYTELLAEDAA